MRCNSDLKVSLQFAAEGRTWAGFRNQVGKVLWRGPATEKAPVAIVYLVACAGDCNPVIRIFTFVCRNCNIFVSTIN